MCKMAVLIIRTSDGAEMTKISRAVLRTTLSLFCLMQMLWSGKSAAGGEAVPNMVIGTSEGRIIRVLCMETQPPYFQIDSHGKMRGVYVDLLKLIAQKKKMRFLLSPCGAGDVKNSMHQIQPEIVLGSLYPVDPDQERFGYLPVHNLDPIDPCMAENVARILVGFSEAERDSLCFALPFLWESSTVFLPSGRTDGLNELRGKRICVVAGAPEEKFLTNLGFKKEIMRCSSAAKGLHILAGGMCDAFVCETFQGRYQLEQSRRYRYAVDARKLPLQSYERGLVVLHGDVAMTLKIGHALAEMKLDGSYSAVMHKWLGQYDEFLLSPRIFVQTGCAVLLFIGAILFWNYELKRKIRIAFSERDRILDFICDGILAVDSAGRITMLNRAARQLLELKDSDVGKSADELIPGLDIRRVIDDCQPVYNLEQNLREALVSCNKVPVFIKGNCYGAIVTLRDLSELQAMAEEMTGVKMYVESLRIRNHEFMNTLQAISGLVQLGQYDKAVAYIVAETDSSQSAHSFMTERIKNAAVCGVLMGKAGLCREQGINFVLDPDSFCADHSAEISARSLVIVVGNLMQNAVEALQEKGVDEHAEIRFSVYDESGYIFLSVRDNAGLMNARIAERLFDKGFSTKKRDRPSGFGLYTINNIVTSLGGDVSVDFAEGEYTDFTVTIPLSKKREALSDAGSY